MPGLSDAVERGSRRAHVLEGLAVALISLLCAIWVLRLWRADLGVPLRYAPVDDTKFYLMLVKGIVEHGSYLENSSLGAPYGQHLADYPQGGDDLSLLLVRGLALFTSSAALIVNLFFLLTFALSSFTAHLVMRSLGVAAPAAGVASVLFSLLAYHFFRGESHLLLSAYFAVPLSAYLFLQVLAGAPLFSRRPATSAAIRCPFSRRSLSTLAICVVIGSTNLYYATFAVAMLCAAGLLTALARRRPAALSAAALVALIVATVAVNLSPTLIERAEHGPDVALERSAAFTESSDEAFSLRLANLLLPAPASRFAPLARATARYDHATAPGYCEACYASLGSVGDLGLLWLALGALASLLGAAAWFAARPLLRHAAVGVAVAFAFGSIGGLGGLIQQFVTPDIRAWNRISVLIAFFSLLGAAVALERLTVWLRRRRHGAALAGAVALVVLVFGVYDQSSDSFVPAYGATARQWHSDAAFVDEIQRRLAPGAAIFQLPYVPFPEGYPETPVGDAFATYATKYESLRGYLHSSTLRWSYGAVKGRPDDWSAALAAQPLAYVLDAVAATGFDGLWVDPAGFEPAKSRRLRAELAARLGVAPLVSRDGDLWFFDLRPFAAALTRTRPAAQLAQLRGDTLHPLLSRCARGGLMLINPSPTARPAILRARLAPTPTASGEASAALPPDGQAGDIPAATSMALTRRLTLAPGRTFVALSPSAPGAAPARVLYGTVTDTALAPLQPDSASASGDLIPGLTGPTCG